MSDSRLYNDSSTGDSILLEAFHSRCRQAGLRLTPQRAAIYRALINTDQHPSAYTVHKIVSRQFPCISLDTVNRTLLTLAQIGAAFVVEGGGDTRRFDGNVNSHQYFRCVGGRKIIDFRHEPFDDIELPESIKDRFIVFRKTIYIEGLCEDCRVDSDKE